MIETLNSFQVAVNFPCQGKGDTMALFWKELSWHDRSRFPLPLTPPRPKQSGCGITTTARQHFTVINVIWRKTTMPLTDQWGLWSQPGPYCDNCWWL